VGNTFSLWRWRIRDTSYSFVHILLLKDVIVSFSHNAIIRHRRTDRLQYHDNSRSYCVAVRSSKNLVANTLKPLTLGQLSLPSMSGWGWWGVFTCVGWKVTLCDPIWQVALRSCVMGFRYTLPFTFFINSVWHRGFPLRNWNRNYNVMSRNCSSTNVRLLACLWGG